VLAEISSQNETHISDKIRPVSQRSSEVRFIANQELLDKIQILKGLLAHQMPQASLADVLNKLCDIGIEKLSPAAPQKRCIKKISIKRIVWRRDESKCQKCGSKFALQIDHIIPKAKNGESNLENLRLLCRNCNQRSAIEHFGATKMTKWLEQESAAMI